VVSADFIGTIDADIALFVPVIDQVGFTAAMEVWTRYAIDAFMEVEATAVSMIVNPLFTDSVPSAFPSAPNPAIIRELQFPGVELPG
jgi:hypothetical protein